NTPTRQPKFTVSHPHSTNPQYFGTNLLLDAQATQLLNIKQLHNKANLLFAKGDSTWATKYWFITRLKQLLPDENLARYSFRAGGTTELVMCGVQLVLIQKIGRWDSESFYRYIRSHPTSIVSILTKAYSD
ncbi:23392_t:CDS:2, partial [Racocetra persica]